MKSNRATLPAMAMLPIVVIGLVALADTIPAPHTWTGGSPFTNNWNDAANWIGAAAPADGDSAIIDDTSPQSIVQYDVGTADYGMADILLGDGMTLEFLSSNTLELYDLLTIEGDVIIKGTGKLDGATTGRLRIDGGLTGSSLTKQGEGTCEVFIGPDAP